MLFYITLKHVFGTSAMFTFIWNETQNTSNCINWGETKVRKYLSKTCHLPIMCLECQSEEYKSNEPKCWASSYLHYLTTANWKRFTRSPLSKATPLQSLKWKVIGGRNSTLIKLEKNVKNQDCTLQDLNSRYPNCIAVKPGNNSGAVSKCPSHTQSETQVDWPNNQRNN